MLRSCVYPLVRHSIQAMYFSNHPGKIGAGLEKIQESGNRFQSKEKVFHAHEDINAIGLSPEEFAVVKAYTELGFNVMCRAIVSKPAALTSRRQCMSLPLPLPPCPCPPLALARPCPCPCRCAPLPLPSSWPSLP